MSNRRKFLKQAALGSAPFILPSHIWAAKGDTSPNNRINVAIIGLLVVLVVSDLAAL